MIVSKHVEIDKPLSANMEIDDAGMFHVHSSPSIPHKLEKFHLEKYMRGHNALISEALGLRADLALTAYANSQWE